MQNAYGNIRLVKEVQFDNTLAYAVGLFNGVGDGASGDLDKNDRKDWDGRIVVRPFLPTSIEPLRGLDPKNGTIGAIEVVARYGEILIDDGARQFADPSRSAQRALAWGVGVNWHLARNFTTST